MSRPVLTVCSVDTRGSCSNGLLLLQPYNGESRNIAHMNSARLSCEAKFSIAMPTANHVAALTLPGWNPPAVRLWW